MIGLHGKRYRCLLEEKPTDMRRDRPGGEVTGPTSGREAFRRLRGGPPTHVARAPGRVNLIGEHIDYCGLPVLPMAIQRRVSLLFRPREDGTVYLSSALTGFGPREFRIGPEIDPFPAGDWGNYPKAAARAVAQGYGVRRGLDGLVVSDLPVAAGLSSSSALVVACALALLQANGIRAETLPLAERLAKGERYVGLEGGGMDQAICLGAGRGTAALVEFDPLRLAPVPVPAEWGFVVCHSLSRAEKSGRARGVYNQRTRECREGLAAVGARLGVGGRKLSYRRLLAEWGPEELAEVGAAVLPDPLRRRFRHVVLEAARVEAARRALEEENLDAFGRLLDASHRSLRDDYEVSTSVLDTLVRIARSAGAAGARLTGAGLGGCVLAVCRRREAPSVVEALAEGFYADRSSREDLEDLLFEAVPSGPAAVSPL